MKTSDYLELLKPLAKSPTVYAVAALLDLNEDTVRNWAKGRSTPDVQGCIRIAAALGIDAMTVIGHIEAERRKGSRRRTWGGPVRALPRAARS